MDLSRTLSPAQAAIVVLALARSGLLRLYRPDQLASIASALARYGFGPGVGPTVGSACYPTAPAIVDDTGRWTMRQLDGWCSGLADTLRRRGVSAGDRVGLLGYNSAAFYATAVGASRLGADVVYLNTGFTADQIADVARRYPMRLAVSDPELAERLPRGLPVLPLAGPGADGRAGSPRLPVPGRASRHVILTSGTTGAAKGVPRTGGGPESVLAMLSGLPLRVRRTHLVAAPMFHAWGWLHLLLTMLLSSTLVVARRFDARDVLGLVERHRCEVLVAVPVMLRRILDLPADVRSRYDTGCLRVVAVSGSALSADLAHEFMRAYGDVLYSLYGSTEAGFATVATPEDLWTAPGTAGRPLPTVRVRVADGYGRTCPPGVPGVVMVAGRDAVPLGAGREVRTGDLGWIDAHGRLYLGGREDDMVIVGGENVYPAVVEHALERHPDIVEAAVFGAPDRTLGQVVVAHVALRTGATATPGDIRSWCRGQLAPFQVPRRVVVHERLPRNATGKVVTSVLADADALTDRPGWLSR
jgi:acyl-CoA synthetase (AMP-forming)/AMP-acid ligase II